MIQASRNAFAKYVSQRNQWNESKVQFLESSVQGVLEGGATHHPLKHPVGQIGRVRSDGMEQIQFSYRQ